MKYSIHYLNEFGMIIDKDIPKLFFWELDLNYWEDAGNIEFKRTKKSDS